MPEQGTKEEQNTKKPELLCPAKDLDVLKTAVRFGADAVYIGGEAYSLRAKSKNFTKDAMQEGIAFAHAHDAAVYVAANILAHDEDLKGAETYFEQLEELKPDGLILSDPGMFMLARKVCPDIPIHISTQSSCTNAETFLFWHDLGAKRVVCARELSLEEIASIRRKVPSDLEIEAFVHGAMCISYSGRCLLSAYFTGRGANQGECAHPCRWKYAIMEETRPGEYLPITEDERGTYLLNSKDLCMIEHIPDLMKAGIDSYKIEGRMKNALYVASAARSYRKAIDDCLADKARYEKNLPWYRREIRSCTYRKYTTGFYYGKPGPDALIYDSNTYVNACVFLGICEEAKDPVVKLVQRNKFCVGDEIEIMKPDGRNVRATVQNLFNEAGEKVESAPHPQEVLYVELSEPAQEGDLLRTVPVAVEE